MLYSRTLAMVSWASVFTLGWLLVLRKIPSDLLSWGFLIFFLFVAIVASAFATGPTKPNK